MAREAIRGDVMYRTGCFYYPNNTARCISDDILTNACTDGEVNYLQNARKEYADLQARKEAQDKYAHPGKTKYAITIDGVTKDYWLSNTNPYPSLKPLLDMLQQTDPKNYNIFVQQLVNQG